MTVDCVRLRRVALVLACAIGCRDAPPEPATAAHDRVGSPANHDPVWDTRFLRAIAAESGPAKVMIQRLGRGAGERFAGRTETSGLFVLEPKRAAELLSLLADKASFAETGPSQSPCKGAQVAVTIERDDERLISVFDCGRFFLADNTLVATVSPALYSLMTRLAAEVFPCEWQRLDTLDAEVCVPAGANVSRTASSFEVSAPDTACPSVRIGAPDSASRQFVHRAGSLAVSCVHDGKSACAESCETIRPIPRPTRARSSPVDEAVISLSVGGGMAGGPLSHVAVWNDGTVELTSFRCTSGKVLGGESRRAGHTVGTTMSAGALALLLSRLKQARIAEAIGSHENVADGFRHSLRVRIDDVVYQLDTYGDPTSRPLNDSVALIDELVGVPRCD